jgi:hypothetical protein
MERVSMPVNLELSDRNLKERLAALFAKRTDVGELYVGLELLDGTVIQIEPEQEWDIEIGADFVSVERVLKLGPTPSAPRIIPFTSLKSIHVID